MTKNEAIQRAMRLEREVNECCREIRSLTAANQRMREALERIVRHLGLPCEKRDDGVLEHIAREALKEEL